MLFSSIFLALCECAALIQAASSPSNQWGQYQVVEEAPSANGWAFQGPADSTELLTFNFVLKNDVDLDAKLNSVSHPDSPSYGRHFTKQQVINLFAIDNENVKLIKTWLSTFSGVEDLFVDDHTGTISIQTTIGTANQLLETDFGRYHQKNSSVIRALKYSLPEVIKNHIELVHPVTYFPTLAGKERPKIYASTTQPLTTRQLSKADPAVLKACENGIYPACIAAMYNLTYTPPTNAKKSGSKLGVTGFLQQQINHTDVTSFIRKYGNSAEMRAHPGKFNVELVNNGTNNETLWGVEATLDMEYSMAFTGNLPVTFYSTGGRSPRLDEQGHLTPLNQSTNEPYLEWLQYMLAKPDGGIPQVISISYTDTEQTVPRKYATHVCELFGRLALRGVSIINASGDGGVAGQEDVPCISNDGQNRTTFLPTFPASCPWVTAVGATTVIPEQGAALSSGGFSNYFAVPKYQRNATSSYIKYLKGQYSGLYNQSGRGIPDVALYGSRYQTENNNVTSGYHSGTSAGTPVFAAMIALVNDMRLRNGKPVLGWLNPVLYAQKSEVIWNDITDGRSFGCESSWNATTGWDALTGLGSPDFKRLAKALK